MTVIQINFTNIGSTGKIMLQIAKRARNQALQVYTCCANTLTNRQNNDSNSIFIGNRFCRKGIEYVEKFFGLNNCLSVFATYLFIQRIKKRKPTLIHLHNLHSNYINFPILFHYIKKQHIPVIWTLHDCWSFTGRCPYFDLTKCDKWQKGCHACPYSPQLYPQAYIDTTRIMWKLKKYFFTGIENCTIVTPSQWLANHVKQSFLKNYPIKVINNGIDLSVFQPTESDFRERHNLTNKKIVLGVAFSWDKRKGSDIFIDLSKRLPCDYQIILVGINSQLKKQLPPNIISINRTQNQKELAEIYTAADVFANPTREENYPTVNMEAIACGTPVVTFRTGGSPEILDETCGSIVDCDDIDTMEIEIRRICEQKPYSVEACLKRAKSFDMNDRFEEYVDLYKEIENKQ